MNQPPADLPEDPGALSPFIAPLSLLCDALNRAAVFHPQVDEDTLPCLVVGGIQLCGYLGHDPLAFRVSVRLGNLASDALVPMVVDVESTTLMDASDPTRVVFHGAADTFRRLLEVADDDLSQAIREAAREAGLLWQCPKCLGDNAEAARTCDVCRETRPEDGK